MEGGIRKQKERESSFFPSIEDSRPESRKKKREESLTEKGKETTNLSEDSPPGEERDAPHLSEVGSRLEGEKKAVLEM